MDSRSAEAYGTNAHDVGEAFKNDGTIKNFRDPRVAGKTMEYKSHEWLNQAREAERVCNLRRQKDYEEKRYDTDETV